MAVDLRDHPLFEPWSDPETGVESFILGRRVAPFQKGLYYVTPSVPTGGGWLWFKAAWPPSRRWTLAAARLAPDRPEVRVFPAADWPGNPLLVPEGDAAYVAIGDGLYRLPFDGEAEEVARMPAEIIRRRYLFRLVTDLTMSCHGRHFLLDSHIGNRWLISLVDVASGELKPLKWFSREHHHAAFSLHDPELFMVNHGPAYDPITGEKTDMDVRMWVMDTRLARYEPVQPDRWFGHNSMSCHEWWTADGKIDWCDYHEGVYEVDPDDGRRALVWPRRLVHGQCDPSGRFYCGDQNPYDWSDEKPCGVWFFDRRSGREIAIASRLPEPPVPVADRRGYHLDPHPHFSADARWVVYTTTARGTVDVAVAPVDPILERLG